MARKRDRQGAREGDDFSWTRLDPGEHTLYPHTYSVFLIQVESQSETGKQLLKDPIPVLRKKIPEMKLPARRKNVRATVLRVNAEIAANPIHRSEVWIIYPYSATAVGVQYKYETDQTKAKPSS